MFVVRVRYSEQAAREAIAESRSYAEALRRLAMCASGGNWQTLKRYATEIWLIPVDHFDPHAASRDALARNRRAARPLAEILVEGSTYSRAQLKDRLYEAGLKARRCELCGQGERWRGRAISLILDHVNGVRDDNRLENLRIVCPNCAATLDTHCGRNVNRTRPCATCGAEFTPAGSMQRHCSHRCGSLSEASRSVQRAARRVERPPYEQLMAEIAATSWSAVGRKYGVSDNAIRKWVRVYERARASVEADGAAGGGIPGPVGAAATEVDASEPAVDRGAPGRAVEDRPALGRELVAAVREADERGEVGREGEDGRLADPRWVLVGGGGDDEVRGRERAVAERLEDLPLEPALFGVRAWLPWAEERPFEVEQGIRHGFRVGHEVEVFRVLQGGNRPAACLRVGGSGRVGLLREQHIRAGSSVPSLGHRRLTLEVRHRQARHVLRKLDTHLLVRDQIPHRILPEPARPRR
jgi:transposase-like protein